MERDRLRATTNDPPCQQPNNSAIKYGGATGWIPRCNFPALVKLIPSQLLVRPSFPDDCAHVVGVEVSAELLAEI